jgi:very-short-patch-repair endonuclease
MSQKETGVFHTPPELWRKLKPLARQKRHEPTAAEDRLWQCLRNRQVGGAKFRRQYTIDRFIVDFYCPAARLVVEVDGPIHDYTPEEDAIRQAFIEAQDMVVLRFTNTAVIEAMDAVLERIKDVLREHNTAE